MKTTMLRAAFAILLVACTCAAFAAPAPAFLETSTAKLAAPWLKALDLPPSPDAVVHAMNPYHYQRFFPPSLKQTIYLAGMPAFYADPALKANALFLLASEVKTRSQLMRFGGLYFSRNLTGEGFWEVVEPSPGAFHFEFTDTILGATGAAGGDSLMVIQPYALRDQNVEVEKHRIDAAKTWPLLARNSAFIFME